MSAIDFVVRDGAGTVSRGVVGSEGAAGVVAPAGSDISLNLQRAQVLSYMRDGSALKVTLVNGDVITIQGFFADGVAASDLFLSTNGQLARVDLSATEGDLIFARYTTAEAFGKWSPDDALYFTSDGALDIAGVAPAGGAEAAMLGVPLMAGIGGLAPLAAGAAVLGAGGLALAGGGGGGDDGNTQSGPNPPDVAIAGGTKAEGHVVNAEDRADGVDLSGTGTPGASGTVTVGDVTKDITIGDDGTWVATLDPGEVPEGEYEIGVAVSVSNDGGTSSTSGTLVVDTQAHVSFDADAVETDGTVNFAEESDGFTLGGQTEAGSSVSVTFGGETYEATVTGESWTLDVPAGVVAQGEYGLDVVVTATDAYGNTASTSGTVQIDTQTFVTVDADNVAGDGTVNAAEHARGVTVNGVAEAGASVVVTLGEVSQTVVAQADGGWTAVFATPDVAPGTYELPVTAVSTDLAGNTATASGVIEVDTEISVGITIDGLEGDGIVNAAERADGITLTGTSDPGATVLVDFGGNQRSVVTGEDGTWSANFTAAEVPQGELGVAVTATATDAAGNTASTSATAQIDTLVDPLTASAPVEGDNVVNVAEASDGLSLGGTVEAGSSVIVTFEGTSRAATVDGAGNWSVTFAAGEVPQGEYESTVTIAATDAAGNTAEISQTFMVDTVAPDAPNIESFVKGEDGLRGFGIEQTDAAITAHEYAEGGAGATGVDLGSGGFVNPITSELQFGFAGGHEVPNGSHLVITATDDAGNAQSTLFVLDDSLGQSAIDVGAGALDGFNIGAIDLELFAEEAAITLDAADIVRLTGEDNALIINGKSDDSVALNGSATATGTTVIDGHDYTVWDVGGDASLIIRDEVDFTQSLV